ncbi:dolichol kinase [Natronosalvus rutilus]|uniref:Dolichol kinase n=1 Tax=Natronosalvus rutilus TaxID=2953753 RepID=A0A9E7SYZ8_9EURY|nr:dolichol kinase [Natronosalvus rutilus]UTF55543.1 dolichol kinase [Natronosalvus rutilus]
MADELKRRLVHASGSGLVALYLLAGALELGLTWPRFQVLMVVLALGAVVLELLRLHVGLEWWLYDKLTREYEQNQFAGYGYYMVSMTIVVLLFPEDIALPAMLMLAIGDPIAGYVSADTLTRFKDRKTLVTMFVVSTLLALPFFLETPLVAVAAALGATIADGITIRVREFVVDDNLTIPLYAAVLGSVALAIVPL